VVSQRNTRAVDHHHPLRPLAPLGFSDSCAPFSPERNCRPETIRSTSTAGAGSNTVISEPCTGLCNSF
jgi:hypothetical protein